MGGWVVGWATGWFGGWWVDAWVGGQAGGREASLPLSTPTPWKRRDSRASPHLRVGRGGPALQHLDRQLEAEQQLVGLKQAGGHVCVHVARDLVAQRAQARVERALLLAGAQRLRVRAVDGHFVGQGKDRTVGEAIKLGRRRRAPRARHAERGAQVAACHAW